jgi:hypothetical protein
MTQPAIDDRLRESLQSMFDSYAARLLYAVPWDYQVRAVQGGAGAPVTLDLVSTDPRMPNLTACPVWPGSDGSVAEPGVGATIMVVFSGGDPAKYRTTLTTGSNSGGQVVFGTPFIPTTVAATVTEGL